MKSANKSINGFQILKSDKASKAMLEYAQMCILLAIQRFPNSFFEQTKLISQKFNQKYKKDTVTLSRNWNSCVIEKGYGGVYYLCNHSILMEYDNKLYYIWI